MQSVAFYCYALSMLPQAIAVLISFTLTFKITGIYRWAWLSLTIGLTLMLSRRVLPIMEIYSAGSFYPLDAFFALAISLLILVGIFGISALLRAEQFRNETLSLLTKLDPLTNCICRNEIFFRIAEEIERTLRTGNSFSVLELDIDHFKGVNDRYGHQVGDEILIGLKHYIQQSLRSIDSLGRIGGEEFLVLLPETNETKALDAAERIRKHIANTMYQTSWKEPLQITISVGVTTFRISQLTSSDKADLLSELVKKADDAMYCAKNSGRNCARTL